MKLKQVMKTAGQAILNILAGIAVVALLVIKWLWRLLDKHANVLTLVGVVVIIALLCRG